MRIRPLFSWLMLVGCLMSPMTYAEEPTAHRFINITGVVKNSRGEPLAGVTVTLKGTQTATTTDENGVFRINVPTGKEVLVFHFLGYRSQEVEVGGRARLEVFLEQDNASLDEVVVTGYGERKRSEIVGSVATVTGEELMDIPAPNIAGAMRNRIAGVGVSQVSGRPGASITLNIRNASTSPNAPAGATAEPLYIVDGIIVDRPTFDNLDASMIENISILKDASAAIYGAAGAKGVMLVTTKRGKAGKPSITYNGYAGVSDAATRPEMLSAYEHALLMNEVNIMRNAPESDFFSREDLEYIRSLNYKSWFEEMWQPSLTQRHNVGISGGSDRLTFFAGGSYQNENANYAGMNFDKYSFRTGITADFGNGLKADVNFNVDQNVRNARHNITENDASFIESMIVTPKWVPIRIGDQFVNYSANRNPMAYLESGYSDVQKYRGYRINTSLTYQPEFLKGFTARFQISQGSSGTNGRLYQPQFRAYNFVRRGQNQQLFTDQLDPETPYIDVVSQRDARVRPQLGESNSYQGFLTLQYANTFGRHSLEAIVGGEQLESNSESMRFYWRDQLIPGGEEYWAFDVNTLTQDGVTRTETAKRSFFGRLNYDWDKRYIVEVVSRLDASSNFALGNRWGWSPSIGAAWVVSQEEFFADHVPFINFLKLKFNIGITGDDRVEERLWQERYVIDVTNGYLYGENNGNSLRPSVIPNPFITWEKKRTVNFGVEMSLFDNKLDIGAEFFQNKVFDGFDQGGNDITPLYVGYLPPGINYREAYNWGSEFTIGYRAKIAREVNVSASMNFSYGNSIVTRVLYAPGDLLENNIEDGLAAAFGTDPRKYNNNNFGLLYRGTFRTQQEVDAFLSENPNYRLYNSIPQPGWMYFEDTNGDGIINDWDLVPMYENTNPLFASGITLGISYKAFNLSTNINARIGGKVAYDGRARTAPQLTRNVLTLWRDRWTPDNPDGWMPRFDDPSLGRNSTFWMVDGTMVRVNNMTIGYRLPTSLVAKAGLQSARILATGNNLWTLVNPLKYKDPYTSSAYDYPILRTISLGLSVSL